MKRLVLLLALLTLSLSAFGQNYTAEAKFVCGRADSTGPRESMQVDCSDIYSYLGIAPGAFIDGFVYFIAQPFRFTATGVYTVTDGSRVVSQDVEEITVTLR